MGETRKTRRMFEIWPSYFKIREKWTSELVLSNVCLQFGIMDERSIYDGFKCECMLRKCRILPVNLFRVLFMTRFTKILFFFEISWSLSPLPLYHQSTWCQYVKELRNFNKPYWRMTKYKIPIKSSYRSFWRKSIQPLKKTFIV